MKELSEKQLKNIAKLSKEDQVVFLKIFDNSISFKNAKKELKKAKKDYSGVPITDIKYDLICNDFRKLEDIFVSQHGQVDYIITDPPYPKEFVPLYSDLSRFASKVLKPGGSLIAMSGQCYLPEVMNRLSECLNYHWTVSYLTPGGQATQIWPKKINTFWKPLLWFTKGEYKGDWSGDVCKSPVNHNDKNFHHWGQSAEGMIDIIERFTYPKDLIIDPFVGGGTTGIACIKTRRNFIGIDIDQKCIDISTARLKEIEGFIV